MDRSLYKSPWKRIVVFFVEPKKIGAEAVIKTVDFDNRQTILKERVKKSYRIDELDKKLRFQRTRTESKITGEVRRAGVKTPMVFFTDNTDYKIYFELLEGGTLKKSMEKENSKLVAKLAEEWGLMVGKMHSAGIVHGDLTTSNAVVSKGQLYLIDFGLSFFSNRIEDVAEDINLLSQSLKATHNESYDLIWKHFLQGYSHYSGYKKILKRVAEISSRGRYFSNRKADLDI